jgi:hypothetical protein
MDYRLILEEITSDLKTGETLPPPPFLNHMEPREKFRFTLLGLKRSIRLKIRIMSLVNAYYLGYLIENLLPSERFNYKREISKHYEVIARYTYDLFEYAPKQILATKSLTVHDIRPLSRSKILILRDSLIAFDGTQAIEEEVVTIETSDDPNTLETSDDQ